MKATVGAILAGGASTRMGSDKALVVLDGRPMIEHVAGALRAASLDVIVVGRTESPIDAPHLADPDGLDGPAAGLLAALEWSDGGGVFLIGVDQPFARPATILRIVDHSRDGISVPVADGHAQVTFAHYGAGSLEHASRLLSADASASLQSLLFAAGTARIGEDEWSGWGEDGLSWWSIDSPEELTRAEEHIRGQLRSHP